MLRVDGGWMEVDTTHVELILASRRERRPPYVVRVCFCALGRLAMLGPTARWPSCGSADG